MRVEVVARVQLARAAARQLAGVQAKGRFEGVELLVHRQRGAGVHHGMGARVQRLVHRIAHVEQQGLQLVGGLVALAAERCRVGIAVGRLHENQFYSPDLVFQLHGKRGYLALHVSGTVNVLQVAHQFLARGDKLLRRRGHHAAKRCHPLERLTALDAVVEPQLHVIVGLSALVRIEEQQVLQVGGELAGGFAVGLAGCARFAGEGIEQHGTLAVLRRNHAALGAQKHVARCLLGRYAGGQAQDILGRQGQREGAAGFGFGSVSLVDHPVTYRRQQPPVGSQSQNSRLWFVTTISALSARRRAPCTKHDVPK